MRLNAARLAKLEIWGPCVIGLSLAAWGLVATYGEEPTKASLALLTTGGVSATVGWAVMKHGLVLRIAWVSVALIALAEITYRVLDGAPTDAEDPSASPAIALVFVPVAYGLAELCRRMRRRLAQRASRPRR